VNEGGNNNGGAAAMNAIPEGAAEQEADEEKEELYDEINSLYNMENPKGDDPEERKSQYSS
jgi:hypothetical protein